MGVHLQAFDISAIILCSSQPRLDQKALQEPQ